MSDAHDFDFLHGNWRVRHRKLATRLAGADDWSEFDGTSSTRPILGGFSNVEHNFIGDPAGGYALRAFETGTGLWRIWWLDLRSPREIGLPVVGGFDGGSGTFLADDHWNGVPIKVRFMWFKRAGVGPRWEQSFSPDGGRTWELNWSMQFG